MPSLSPRQGPSIRHTALAVAGIALVILATVATLTILHARSKARPGEILAAAGNYRSPSGQARVEITTDPQRQSHLTITFSTPHGPATLHPNEPLHGAWYMCWDEMDRLWVCGLNDGSAVESFYAQGEGVTEEASQSPEVLHRAPPAFVARIPEDLKRKLREYHSPCEAAPSPSVP